MFHRYISNNKSNDKSDIKKDVQLINKMASFALLKDSLKESASSLQAPTSDIKNESIILLKMSQEIVNSFYLRGHNLFTVKKSNGDTLVVPLKEAENYVDAVWSSMKLPGNAPPISFILDSTFIRIQKDNNGNDIISLRTHPYFSILFDVLSPVLRDPIFGVPKIESSAVAVNVPAKGATVSASSNAGANTSKNKNKSDKTSSTSPNSTSDLDSSTSAANVDSIIESTNITAASSIATTADLHASTTGTPTPVAAAVSVSKPLPEKEPKAAKAAVVPSVVTASVSEIHYRIESLLPLTESVWHFAKASLARRAVETATERGHSSFSSTAPDLPLYEHEVREILLEFTSKLGEMRRAKVERQVELGIREGEETSLVNEKEGASTLCLSQVQDLNLSILNLKESRDPNALVSINEIAHFENLSAFFAGDSLFTLSEASSAKGKKGNDKKDEEQEKGASPFAMLSQKKLLEAPQTAVDAKPQNLRGATMAWSPLELSALLLGYTPSHIQSAPWFSVAGSDIYAQIDAMTTRIHFSSLPASEQLKIRRSVYEYLKSPQVAVESNPAEVVARGQAGGAGSEKLGNDPKANEASIRRTAEEHFKKLTMAAVAAVNNELPVGELPIVMRKVYANSLKGKSGLGRGQRKEKAGEDEALGLTAAADDEVESDEEKGGKLDADEGIVEGEDSDEGGEISKGRTSELAAVSNGKNTDTDREGDVNSRHQGGSNGSRTTSDSSDKETVASDGKPGEEAPLTVPSSPSTQASNPDDNSLDASLSTLSEDRNSHPPHHLHTTDLGSAAGSVAAVAPGSASKDPIRTQIQPDYKTVMLARNGPAFDRMMRHLFASPFVAMDCEMAGRHITLLQMCAPKIGDFEKTVYIVDLVYSVRRVALRNSMMARLKAILEKKDIVKILHSPHMDVTYLRNEFQTQVYPLADTQAIFNVVQYAWAQKPGVSKKDLVSCSIGLKNLMEMYGIMHEQKGNVKASYKKNPRIWATRPLPEEMLHYACQDVDFLGEMYRGLLRELLKVGPVFLKDPLLHCIVGSTEPPKDKE